MIIIGEFPFCVSLPAAFKNKNVPGKMKKNSEKQSVKVYQLIAASALLHFSDDVPMLVLTAPLSHPGMSVVHVHSRTWYNSLSHVRWRFSLSPLYEGNRL
jgi:hypothetical protein